MTAPTLAGLLATSRVFGRREAIIGTLKPAFPFYQVKAHPGRLDMVDVENGTAFALPTLAVAVIGVAAAEERISGSLVLQVGSGADSDVLRTEALRRLTNLTAILHVPGKAALLDQIKGAPYIYDANGMPLVGKVVASLPADDVNAAPITPTHPRGRLPGPYCTSIAVEMEIVDD